MIVDPWGSIIAESETEPGVVLASIDPGQVTAARAKVPSLTHGRRFELIEPASSTAPMRVVRGSA
jgi:predicted amidohydrolase